MKKIMSAAAAAALLYCAPAGAAEFAPAPNARHVVDLDTPDASMSLWQLDDLSGIEALRARATFPRVGRKTDYGPVVVIVLANDRSEARLTFLLSPKGAVALLAASRGVAELGPELFMLPVEPKEAFDLEIDWTAEGHVVVRLATKAAREMGGQGFERHEVTMDGAPTRLQVLGGGAEVEFKPLILGALR